MNSSRMLHPISCNYTGVPLGIIDLTITAGHVPYLSHWNEMVCHHPLFSLEQYKLCQHMTAEWGRLAQLIADETATELETTNLRVGFVALLHRLNSIDQDRGVIGLPSILTVQTNLESLIALNYWQNYLQSGKFQFPRLHISKMNNNATLVDIRNYLKACWLHKESYDKGLSEVEEQERSRIAEKALLAIREGWIKPAGKKLLWQYCKGFLQGQWETDRDNWMAAIFLSTSNTITSWEFDEIELMEEIILSNIPGGTSITFSVRERVQQIKDTWKLHYDAFTIEEDTLEFISQMKEEHKDTPEPVEKDYSSKAAFYVARAKWQLAHPPVQVVTTNKQIDSARIRLDNL